MKMHLYKYMVMGAAALSLSLGTISCTDYLDKEPDSNVGEGEAFKNFPNFQGFIEQIYNCIPNKESCYWCTTFNWGEDEIMNTGMGDTHVTAHFDLGDYRWWYNTEDKGGVQSFLHGNTEHVDIARGFDPASTDKYYHSLEHAWYCIRKCNLGLENMDKAVDMTTEEKKFIQGQLYFFRAWWHHQLIEWYGGMPYIDTVLPADEVLTLPRLSFSECAAKCAADYRKAADLLPNDWDNTNIGRKTVGKNDIRITKVCALGYLGKVLLWAASPLNIVGAETGALANGDTYKYDAAKAKEAADALGEAIANIESGKTPYGLCDYIYAEDDAEHRPNYGIYDHVAGKNSKNNYSEIFHISGQSWKGPGSIEAVMRGPLTPQNGSNWNFTKLWGPKVNNLVEHDAVIHMPSANYVNYAYGMANGEPILLADGSLNPNSGFDAKHPYQNRDPRFYHDIIFTWCLQAFLHAMPTAAAQVTSARSWCPTSATSSTVCTIMERRCPAICLTCVWPTSICSMLRPVPLPRAQASSPIASARLRMPSTCFATAWVPDMWQPASQPTSVCSSMRCAVSVPASWPSRASAGRTCSAGCCSPSILTT